VDLGLCRTPAFSYGRWRTVQEWMTRKGSEVRVLYARPSSTRAYAVERGSCRALKVLREPLREPWSPVEFPGVGFTRIVGRPSRERTSSTALLMAARSVTSTVRPRALPPAAWIAAAASCAASPLTSTTATEAPSRANETAISSSSTRWRNRSGTPKARASASSADHSREGDYLSAVRVSDDMDPRRSRTEWDGSSHGPVNCSSEVRRLG
jgi:hypothetical protein